MISSLFIVFKSQLEMFVDQCFASIPWRYPVGLTAPEGVSAYQANT